MNKVLAFLTLSLSALIFAPAASAWDVCNETSYVLRVAVATTVDGALTPKGWQRARPGQCLTFIAETGMPRYVYAESSKAHQGGVREWTGARTLCASDDDFVANTEVSCALQDLTTRKYLAIDPADQNTTFVEPLDYGSKAATAGLQRLLRDNGFTIPKIDGLTGRQTNRNLSKFLKDAELKSSISVAEKIDALEAAAKARQSEIGIEVCNKTEARMWAAIAYREGASWESKGWWAVQPGACLRPFTETIKSRDAHIFALMEQAEGDDHILKSTAAVPAQFCIAESRFSATDRENCAARGYTAASFRPLPNDVDGETLNLTAADFAPKKIGGLRQ